MSKENLIDISDMLTPVAFKRLKRGNVLRFAGENDQMTELRIVRINKTKKTCFAERIDTLSLEEFQKQYDKVVDSPMKS